jgi:aspartyl protease family protein
MSTSNRHLVVEILSWGTCAVLVGLAAVNYQKLTSLISYSRQVVAATPGAGDKSAEKAATSSGAVELKSSSGGHFAASIEVNGRSVDTMVDTGATMVMLTYEAAERAGIYPRSSDFTMRMETANGMSKAAPVMLDRVAIGSILVRNVQAAVAERGKLRTNLLGMSFLGRLKKFEIQSGTLILQD